MSWGLRHLVTGWLLMAPLIAVCTAQSSGWSDPDGVAKVIELNGQVSILKDSVPWALNLGSVVSIKQRIVTGPDGYAVFQVSDGSTFEVYPNSNVTFRNNPSNWKDLLDVWLGRVKVHIQKLGGRPNYNRIQTPTATISVRGTVFDVEVEEPEITLVVVEEGQVAVQHLFLPITDPKLVNAGEYLRVYKDQPLARNVDKGGVLFKVLRVAAEVIYNPPPIGGRSGGGNPTPGGGGTPGTGPGGPSGDTDTTPPPPPPSEGPTGPPPAAP